MSDSFHETEFDPGTQLKLDIYQRYLESALPAFINTPLRDGWSGTINIFDFFCGPGHDSEKNEGSPVLALRTCLKYSENCLQTGKKINLFFNDIDPKKIEILETYIKSIKLPPTINIRYTAKAFEDIFSDYVSVMKNSPNILFIDQFGIKAVNEEVFRLISSFSWTDVLFFISSWHAYRFKDHEYVKPYLTINSSKPVKFNEVHRAIAQSFRDLLPENTKYYLSPFSIKKKSSIHGLIFGSKHLLALSKFSKIAWDVDPIHGDSNFDIDQDGIPDENSVTPDLFAGMIVAKKIEVFQEDLRKAILAGRFDTDLSIFAYSLESGFLPVKHAKPIVNQLVKEGAIEFDGRVRLSEACISDPRKFRLLNK